MQVNVIFLGFFPEFYKLNGVSFALYEARSRGAHKRATVQFQFHCYNTNSFANSSQALVFPASK